MSNLVNPIHEVKNENGADYTPDGPTAPTNHGD
jgi:hypothetical protein